MRRTFSIAALVAVLSGTAFLVAPAASAATVYPPPLCTPTTGAQSAGGHQVGETFSVTLTPVCIFTPGATVTITVNGQVVGTKVADASGSVTVTINVASATSLLVEDPVRAPGQCGANSLSANGPSQVAQTNVTQTAAFDVLCPGAVPQAQQGRVAFTGANVARMAALALALIGIGSVLVVGNRRRRAHAGS